MVGYFNLSSKQKNHFVISIAIILLLLLFIVLYGGIKKLNKDNEIISKLHAEEQLLEEKLEEVVVSYQVDTSEFFEAKKKALDLELKVEEINELTTKKVDEVLTLDSSDKYLFFCEWTGEPLPDFRQH